MEILDFGAVLFRAFEDSHSLRQFPRRGNRAVFDDSHESTRVFTSMHGSARLRAQIRDPHHRVTFLRDIQDDRP